MKITVKPLKGENFEVEADGDATVEQLKGVIGGAKPEYPAAQQKLIHAGRILKDDSKVSEIGLKEREFIVVMVAKAKAPVAATPAPAATPAVAPAAPEGGAQATPAAGGEGGDAAATAAANLVVGPGMEATVTQLCDMGFPRAEVERCLAAAFNNPDRAVEYLMNGIPESVLNAAAAGGAEPGPNAPAGGGGAPPPAQGGGAMPFPAATGGGGGGAALPPELQELRNSPQFAQLAGLIAQNPQMLQQMLPALQQSNPGLVQVIQENPQAFLQMVAEAGGGLRPGQGGGGGGPGPGQTVITLTEEEQAAVNRLTALGFDRSMAAQAYFACDKNEELAANFLFDSANDMMD